jgi:amidophosphoribosyltransferase
LIKDSGSTILLNDIYKKCKSQEGVPKEQIVNYVREVYEPFTVEQISDKIAEMLTPEGINAEVKIVYQSIENLHEACPGHTGDWYFTGNYPTAGGNKVVNKAFINFMEGSDARAY